MPGQGPCEPDWVLIPAGPFTMGSSDGQIDRLAQVDELAARWREKGSFAREQPPHTVLLPDYAIARHPVTVGEYRAFVGAGGYRRRRFWTEAGWAWRQAGSVPRPALWDDPQWAGDDRLPVVGVSWYEALAYCQWLRDGSGCAVRLPSEAEWEKAARGTDGRLLPWGDTFDGTRCNVRASGLGRTVPVGAFSPAGDSPYGCADMVGNVSEWTLSQFRPYPYDPQDGREDLRGEAVRVIRGGSWRSPNLRARTVSRGMNDPWFADRDVGFRCACS